jgi:hypothetical protein
MNKQNGLISSLTNSTILFKPNKKNLVFCFQLRTNTFLLTRGENPAFFTVSHVIALIPTTSLTQKQLRTIVDLGIPLNQFLPTRIYICINNVLFPTSRFKEEKLKADLGVSYL